MIRNYWCLLLHKAIQIVATSIEMYILLPTLKLPIQVVFSFYLLLLSSERHDDEQDKFMGGDHQFGNF